MFLRPADLALMKKDMRGILASAEAVHISIQYQAPVGPVVVNEVYGVSSPSAWSTQTITATAIQKFIHPNNLKVTQWGILDAGDCIFYISPDVDLSGIPLDTAVIKSGNLNWQGVPLANRAFYESLEVLIGNQQFFQVLPAKLA